ncbi:hypothetical protein MMC25_001272 [Agyrium rufum]|nr:hypothetical protein [Agyrium rufum]
MPLPRSEFVSSSWSPNLFQNKVVFCTGGSGSICSAQVRALVALGANACIVGRNPTKTVAVAKDIATARPGGKVLGIGEIDVRSIESLESAVKQCVDELGSLDFLIAGAAGNFLATIQQLSANAMKSVIDIDVLGSFNVLKASLPHLLLSAKRSKEEGSAFGPGGRVIFVSATFHYSGMPMQAHVSAAKAAVDSLSGTTALEFGPFGITSNVIAPGPISSTEGMARLSKPELLEEATSLIPLGRMGSVKDVADATVFLFSDAGSWITGLVMQVDGGHWRTASKGMGGGVPYPDFLLQQTEVTGVQGMKKKKDSKL